MAAFGCHLSNHQAEHQNTGSRYVGARLWRQRFLLTEASITAHQRQKLKQKTKQNEAKNEYAPTYQRKNCTQLTAKGLP